MFFPSNCDYLKISAKKWEEIVLVNVIHNWILQYINPTGNDYKLNNNVNQKLSTCEQLQSKFWNTITDYLHFEID